MRSAAHFRGHPIHPALIPFPIACLVLGFAFDLAGVIFARPSLSTTAFHMMIAGIGFGLLAAVPGIIDYRNAVPPDSSAKARARKHGLLNATALLLFGISVALHGRDHRWVPLALETLGAVALLYSGWLGGVLVNRNLMGVDHRYADGGKWKEETVPPSRGQLVVAREDELKPGHMKLLRVDDRRIVLARTDRRHVAFDDRCSHRGASLAGGVLVGDTVQCLWHGSQFNVESGAVRCGPAKDGIRCYKVDSAGGSVRLWLS